MKKLFLLLIVTLVSFVTISQSRIENFVLENKGLQIITHNSEYTVIKYSMQESATVFPAGVYNYTIVATLVIKGDNIELKNVENTQSNNNSVLLDLENYRGGFKENITKSGWQKIVNNVNKKIEELIGKY